MRPVLLETPLRRNSAEAVALLEEFLALAKQGELEAVALVGMRPDGTCQFGWSPTERFTTMAGGIAVLQSRLIGDHT